MYIIYKETHTNHKKNNKTQKKQNAKKKNEETAIIIKKKRKKKEEQEEKHTRRGRRNRRRRTKTRIKSRRRHCFKQISKIRNKHLKSEAMNRPRVKQKRNCFFSVSFFCWFLDESGGVCFLWFSDQSAPNRDCFGTLWQLYNIAYITPKLES